MDEEIKKLIKNTNEILEENKKLKQQVVKLQQPANFGSGIMNAISQYMVNDKFTDGQWGKHSLDISFRARWINGSIDLAHVTVVKPNKSGLITPPGLLK